MRLKEVRNDSQSIEDGFVVFDCRRDHLGCIYVYAIEERGKKMMRFRSIGFKEGTKVRATKGRWLGVVGTVSKSDYAIPHEMTCVSFPFNKICGGEEIHEACVYITSDWLEEAKKG